MLSGTCILLVLQKQRWWQHLSPHGEKINNLVRLDSESKETGKDVLTLKAACI